MDKDIHINIIRVQPRASAVAILDLKFEISRFYVGILSFVLNLKPQLQTTQQCQY